ncbi:MAG: NADP-dependent oxidoreductase [Pseudomonadota bacterium]
MKQIIVAELPKAALTPEHFRLEEVAAPEMGDGDVRLKVVLMSIDAANRAWMAGPSYRDAVNAGDVMPTYAICEVVESRSPRLSPGDVVASEAVWAEEVVRPANRVQKMPPVAPLSHLLSVYGIAGKTAYHGLVGIGRPMAGETVLVSAAAGSVGGFVGQIAKALGCRIVGIAGGPTKCAWVVDHLGFDACLDYREPELGKRLAQACPDGVDIYFDNVGGAVLEAALFHMNTHGRVVCCGAISQYDSGTPQGPRNLPGLVVMKRLRMEGFIVLDHARDDAKAVRALQHWVASGQVTVTEDIVDGLENAPHALIGLLAGDNTGKRMVRVAPDPS